MWSSCGAVVSGQLMSSEQLMRSGSGCAVWCRCWIAGPQDQCILWFSSSISIFISGWQDEARKGGHILLLVEVGELGSYRFLQVEACKLGGHGLLPVAAGKLKSL